MENQLTKQVKFKFLAKIIIKQYNSLLIHRQKIILFDPFQNLWQFLKFVDDLQKSYFKTGSTQCIQMILILQFKKKINEASYALKIFFEILIIINYFISEMCFLKSKRQAQLQTQESQKEELQDHLNINQIYQFNENSSTILGQGGFSKVVQGKRIGTKQLVAIKIISKSQLDENSCQMIQKQNQILSQINHPNIIKYIQSYETAEKLYLILEYCSGGQLMAKLENEGKFEQNKIKKIFWQLVSAVDHIHKKSIVHRDLKLENVLFLNKEQNSTIKLIDFGFATKIHRNQKLKAIVGTPYYMAPEVLKGFYDQSCDIWSLGIILYILKFGYPPFYGETQQQIYDLIKHSKYTYTIDQDDSISEQCLDLLDGCLCNPEQRLTANEILNHVWFEEIDDYQ